MTIDIDRLEAEFLGKKPTGNGADANAAPPRSANGKASTRTPRAVKTAKMLQSMTFAPLKYIVPNLIVEGLVILAGKPKVGKSWAALDIALSVADGRYTLGDRKCAQGTVLYLALEDGERRMKRRITKLLPTFNGKWTEHFHYDTQWPRADQGGVEQIDAWCADNPDARLVVIDVLARFRTPASGRNAYQEDYAALAKLQELAIRRSITIIVVHHTRKGVSEDPVEEISGTLGLSGSADAFLVLKRTSSGATLSGRSRDTDDVDLAVQFSKDTCRWTILGEAAEIHRSDQRASVLAALVEGPASTQEIMAEAGIRSRAAADQLLHRMAKAGEIKRCGRGKYSLPDAPLSEPLSEVSESQKGAQAIDDTCVNPPSDTSDTSDRGGRKSEKNAAGKPNKWHAPKLSESSGDAAAEFLKSTGWKN